MILTGIDFVFFTICQVGNSIVVFSLHLFASTFRGNFVCTVFMHLFLFPFTENRLGIGSHDYCKFKHWRKHPSELLLSPLVVAAASGWIAWELLKTAPPTVSEILSSTTDMLSSPRFPST